MCVYEGTLSVYKHKALKHVCIRGNTQCVLAYLFFLSEGNRAFEYREDTKAFRTFDGDCNMKHLLTNCTYMYV
jgi:hypothetical protein